MDAQTTIWGIHHSGGQQFVNQEAIAIGWPDAGDLTDLPDDRDAFKDLLRERYPSRSEAWVANAAGQLLRFRHVMALGDLIVYPRKADRTINIGTLAGDYLFDPAVSDYPNLRAVSWTKTDLPRDGFTQGCLYEFGSALSVFTISTHAGEVLSALDATPMTMPVGAASSGLSATASPPTEDEPSAGQIEELTKDFVLKAFKTELKGHPFAQFCGSLLEALGYTTRVSPPGADQGIDIVASEDALGVKQPLLKVQCKSSNSPSGSEQVQALNGALGPTDLGVFIAVGGFTAPARQVAAGMPRMRLVGPSELVELVLDHYAALPDETKTDVPLRRVWMPDRPTAED